MKKSKYDGFIFKVMFKSMTLAFAYNLKDISINNLFDYY